MSQPWHSPLSSSLPYISSVESYNERGLMYGYSPENIEYEEEDMYRLEEEEIAIASSTEHMTSSTSSTSSTTSSDGSDDEIDAIRRAIETTLGSAEKEDTARNTNPRAKYLARIGVGATRPTPVTKPSTSTSRPSTSRVSRTPPTSPNDVADDDSLDAMLALMGVSDEITGPRVTRSSPIDIPRKISRPIPIPTRVSHPRPSARISVDAWSTKTSQPRTSHGWDSDDDADESYFDSPQTEDLSGSMLFDY